MALIAESIQPLPEGLLCVAMVAIFLLMIPVTAKLERRRLRRAKERFLRGRSPLSDATFLNQMGDSKDQAEFFLAARRAMAQLGDVPPDMIYPQDTWRSLMDLQWDNGYLEDIVFGLERELHTRLPFVYPADDRLSFADYVRQLALCFQRAKDKLADLFDEEQSP
jgi:hypothetical protein